jgi:hypothetical protein
MGRKGRAVQLAALFQAASNLAGGRPGYFFQRKIPRLVFLLHPKETLIIRVNLPGFGPG